MNKKSKRKWIPGLIILLTALNFMSCGGDDEETTWMYTYEDYRVRSKDVEQTSLGDYIVFGMTYDDSLSYALWLANIACTGDLLWEKAVCSGEACAMVVLRDGGCAITDAGSADIHVLKVDSTNTVEWERTYGGPRSDFASSMCATRDGGFVLLGTTEVSFPNQWDHDDLFLLRANASGNEYWKRTYNLGNHYTERGGEVHQTTDGGFVFTGVTHGWSGPGQGLLVKTNEDGYIEWIEYFDSTSVQCMCVCSDHNYAVVFDSMICKFDGQGDTVWAVPFSAGIGRAMCGTNDNGCVITGGSYYEDTDIWAVKFNSQGTVEWSNTYRDEEATYGADIVQTNDGGYVILGCTHDIDFPVTSNMVLIKTNTAGEVIQP